MFSKTPETLSIISVSMPSVNTPHPKNWNMFFIDSDLPVIYFSLITPENTSVVPPNLERCCDTKVS